MIPGHTGRRANFSVCAIRLCDSCCWFVFVLDCTDDLSTSTDVYNFDFDGGILPFNTCGLKVGENATHEKLLSATTNKDNIIRYICTIVKDW